MDQELRDLERVWLESGQEGDRFAWLCRKLRLGPDADQQRRLDDLTRLAQGLYDPEDVSVKCRVGYEASEPDPHKRLVLFSGHRAWWPAPDLDATLEIVLEAKRRGMLYPHRDYDTSELGAAFESLFRDGVVFANFQDSVGDTSWGRSGTPLEGPLSEWETSSSLAIGATLGPLVGFLSVNARDSL
tara:strand:+ start:1451 stop:2008 length:558 start_codon:yes stop_codon:yes gene_type:complete